MDKDSQRVAEDLDFMTRALVLLTPEELRELMTQAARDGYVVSGFRDVKNAPLSSIQNSLKSRARFRERGKNLAIMMRCIENMDGDIPALCRKRRRFGEGNREEALEELEQLEQKRREEAEQKNREQEGNDESQVQQAERDAAQGPDLAEELARLKESEARQRQKLESTEQKLRAKRNESEEYEKQIKTLKKDLNKRENIVKDLEQEVARLREENETYKKNIQVKDREIKELKNRIEVLEGLRERLPKVLCFSRHQIKDAEECLYNIIIKDNISENERYDRFEKIFVVQNDFTFYEYGPLLGENRDGKIEFVRSSSEIVAQLQK